MFLSQTGVTSPLHSVRWFGFPGRGVLGLSLALCWSLVGGLPESCGLVSTAQAEDEEAPPEIEYPIMLLAAHSVDRINANAKLLFEIAERTDIMGLFEALQTANLKDLKGMDRSKPFGLMWYIKPGLTPSLSTLGFARVTNLPDFLDNITAMSGQSHRPVEGKAGRHQFDLGGDNRLYLQQVGDYVVTVGPENDNGQVELDRLFPDLEKLAARITSRHDVGFSLLVNSVPPGMKTLLVELVKSAIQAELQQRDEEPESAYRLRRASGEDTLELMEKLATQTDSITIGGRIDPETRISHLELDVLGLGDKKLAKYFAESGGRKSYFTAAFETPSTLSFSISSLLEQKSREGWVKFFQAAAKDASVGFDKETESTGSESVLKPIFETLIVTAENGHLDAMVQVVGDAAGKYGTVIGFRVQGGQKLPEQVTKALEYLKEHSPSDNSAIKVIELSMGSIESYPLHRFPADSPGEWENAMAGENLGIYLCVTPQAVWLTFGGDPAVETMRERIAACAQPLPPDLQRSARTPLQLLVYGSSWTGMIPEEERDRSFAQNVVQTLKAGQDTLRLTGKPSENGFRIQVEIQPGYLALWGKAIGSARDGATRRQAERERERKATEAANDAGGPDNP